MDKPAGEIIHESMGGQLSEFMDDYLIIGIKAGTKQRMVLDCVTIDRRRGEMKEIVKKAMDWVNKDELGKTK
jgi:hypothetical protein